MKPRDWSEWHLGYDDPASPLSVRLAVVRERIGAALDAAPPGPVRVVSMCAGQGRDLLGVLPDHPRRADVTARLVELDPRLSATARAGAEQAGLDGVEVVTGDASTTDAYAGAVPAGLVLVCGVFGNVSPADIRRTVETLPTLCEPGATVIWTRHRREPDLVPTIVDWMAGAGFTDQWTSPPLTSRYIGVGSARYSGPPRPFRPGERMFTFVSTAADAAPEPD